MGVDFLDFLRSREQDIYGFARRFRRGRSAQTVRRIQSGDRGISAAMFDA
jgi:hypothetical protein